MIDPQRVRSLVGKRVQFRYVSGTKIVGVLLELRPAGGPPFMAILAEADILDPRGRTLGHHDQLSIVPEEVREVEEDPLPAISFRRPNNP